MPETEMGTTSLMNAPKRVSPSTMAASSSSLWMDLKKPISSQVEKGPEMLERRLSVEDEGIVLQIVEVVRLLEGCDEHPVEGERQEHGKHHHDEPVHNAAEDLSGGSADHQATSVRCATRSMR